MQAETAIDKVYLGHGIHATYNGSMVRLHCPDGGNRQAQFMDLTHAMLANMTSLARPKGTVIRYTRAVTPVMIIFYAILCWAVWLHAGPVMGIGAAAGASLFLAGIGQVVKAIREVSQ